MRSTANDLLVFLAAELGQIETSLKAAMAAQLEPRRPTETKLTQTLGWLISESETGQIVWHNGGTGGYRCFMGFDRGHGRGVVVLTNMASTRGGDDIGFHLLSGTPLLPPPRTRQAISLPAAALEPFVGCYRFSPTVEVVITREDTRLFCQLSGQGRYEMFAEGPAAFFLRVADAQVTFETDPDGRVVGLVTHQNGRDRPAARLP